MGTHNDGGKLAIIIKRHVAGQAGGEDRLTSRKTSEQMGWTILADNILMPTAEVTEELEGILTPINESSIILGECFVRISALAESY